MFNPFKDPTFHAVLKNLQTDAEFKASRKAVKAKDIVKTIIRNKSDGQVSSGMVRREEVS